MPQQPEMQNPDPVTATLSSALPYEQQLQQLVDLSLRYGDMDFEDYLPHEILPDFRAAVAARNTARRAAAGEVR